MWDVTQHIHINRYSPKSLKLLSEISRRNISLCSCAQRAPLLSPFWRGNCLVTISSTGKKAPRQQKTDESSCIAHWYSFLWPKTLGYSLQHQQTYPAVEFSQRLLPGCWVHAWQQFTCKGYTSCKPKPAQKINPDSLQAKFHLLVFHHQVTDVSDRQVSKQLDVVPSDLVKQLGICISTRQNEASKVSMDDWPSWVWFFPAEPQFFPEPLLAISSTARALSPQVWVRLCKLTLQALCSWSLPTSHSILQQTHKIQHSLYSLEMYFLMK